MTVDPEIVIPRHQSPTVPNFNHDFPNQNILAGQ
jgi:hypothetical protein